VDGWIIVLEWMGEEGWDGIIVDGLTSSFTEHFTCLGETAGPAPHHPRGKGKDHG